jgi:hypothetical protein
MFGVVVLRRTGDASFRRGSRACAPLGEPAETCWYGLAEIPRQGEGKDRLCDGLTAIRGCGRVARYARVFVAVRRSLITARGAPGTHQVAVVCLFDGNSIIGLI